MLFKTYFQKYLCSLKTCIFGVFSKKTVQCGAGLDAVHTRLLYVTLGFIIESNVSRLNTMIRWLSGITWHDFVPLWRAPSNLHVSQRILYGSFSLSSFHICHHLRMIKHDSLAFLIFSCLFHKVKLFFRFQFHPKTPTRAFKWGGHNLAWFCAPLASSL